MCARDIYDTRGRTAVQRKEDRTLRDCVFFCPITSTRCVMCAGQHRRRPFYSVCRGREM